MVKAGVAQTPGDTVRQLNAGRSITPENVLVLYRTGDSVGQQVAQYYQSVRGIPASNVLSIGMAWTPASANARMTDADALTVLGQILPTLRQRDIFCIVTCHWWPLGNQANTGSTLATLQEILGFPFYYHAYNLAIPGSPPEPFPNRFSDAVTAQYPAESRNIFDALLADLGTYLGLLPKNRMALLGERNTSYVHFRLEVSPVPAADPIGSEYNYIKRMIDDGVAAEVAEYANLGTVLLQGASYSAISRALLEYADTGLPAANVYMKNLNTSELGVQAAPRSTDLRDPSRRAHHFFYNPANWVYVPLTRGITGASEPTWPDAIGQSVADGTNTWLCIADMRNRMHGADTEITPGIGGYTAYSDVFLHFIGTDAYYTNKIQPLQRSDVVYRQGAIVGWGQSYSAQPTPYMAIEWDYGTRSLNALTETNCLSSGGLWASNRASLPVTNENGIALGGIWINRASGVTTATVGVSGTTITLRENGTPVATIVTTPGTMRSILTAVRAALPANWGAVAADGSSESRCMTSIKSGACIAIGSMVEPTTSGAFKTTHLASGLWAGQAIGEIAFRLQMPQDASPQDVTGMAIFGDPLYRPFGYR